MNYSQKSYKTIAQILLQAQGSSKNIIWFTPDYAHFGEGFQPEDEIRLSAISKIKPRWHKSKEQQKDRTAKRGEVFTPLKIIRQMTDTAHEQLWNGYPLEYICKTVLEITCGEGAFLTTSHDPATGEAVPGGVRCGLLDRKFRALQEMKTAPMRPYSWRWKWQEFLLLCLKATYGYEISGDSLFLARVNIFKSWYENYQLLVETDPDFKSCIAAAQIISWNIFQMDGLTSKKPCSQEPAVIRDWSTSQILPFEQLYHEQQQLELF